MPKIAGWIFVILMFLTSLFGSIFILIPFFPLVFFNPKRWRICADRLVGYWLTFPAALCEFIFNVKFHVTGDAIRYGEPALLILNHPTRLDWLFFWNVLYKIDPWLLTTEKISLKAQLRLIPGAGWAMGCGSYMFLNRNYESDRMTIEKMISYYGDVGQQYQVLLFPEGTDRNDQAIARSRDYARSHNLPDYQHILHPRTAGFVYMLGLMRKKMKLVNIYDVTIGYPDKIVHSEMDLIKDGQFPNSVHFDIERISIDDIPDSDDGAAEWLSARWSRKETALTQFYSLPSTERAFRRHNAVKWPIDTGGFGRYVTFAIWILTTIMWALFFIEYLFVRVYVCVAVAFYITIQWYYGGVELFVIDRYNRYYDQ